MSKPTKPKALPFSESNTGVLEIINASHLNNILDIIVARPAHALSISEHSIPPADMATVKHRLTQAGWSSCLSSLETELKHHTVGVSVAILAQDQPPLKLTSVYKVRGGPLVTTLHSFGIASLCFAARFL